MYTTCILECVISLATNTSTLYLAVQVDKKNRVYVDWSVYSLELSTH